MTRRREWTIAAIVIVVVAAIVAAVMLRNRALQKMQDETYIPRKSKLTPEIALLQQYVRIDTSNPPGNEMPGARFLGKQLDDAGIRYEIIESAPRRANLYARIKGKRSGEGLILLNHIDVVPA